MAVKKEYDETEIDLLALCKVLWSKALLLALAALIAGAAALAGTFAVQRFRMEHAKYEAAVSMYVVNQKFVTSDSVSYSISLPEVESPDSFMATYIFILESRATLEDVIEAADLPYSYEQLLGMISAEAVEDTMAFTVTVESESPAEAELIANTIAKILPCKIDELMDGSSVHIVDSAVVPAHRALQTPNFTKNTLIGALLGLFVSAAVVTVEFIVSDIIMSADDLKALYPDIPVLALIPDMLLSKKKGYYYSLYYGGGDVDFAVKEAFKRLRTNVMMSFDDGGGSKLAAELSA